MKKILKKMIIFSLITLLFISSAGATINIKNNKNITQQKDIYQDNEISKKNLNNDIDYKISVNIKEIRAYDTIDFFSDPDFYVLVFVNNVKYKSPCWKNQKYITEEWSTGTIDVPDDIDEVDIKIQLWDKNFLKDKLCDISSNVEYGYNDSQLDVELIYDLKSGHWRGDDFIYPYYISNLDKSGYGRLNGCDDNSIYENDRDCEIIFDITQNDPDGDGIPYWTEVNVFGTDPEVNDTGMDCDNDGVPIEWEYKWGHYFYYNYNNHEYESYWFYDPFVKEDHSNIDFDNDGLQNTEEYLTSKWGSDPFRKDIFLELNQMELGPDNQGGFVPELSKQLIQDPFRKHNIFLHIDDGCMGGGQKNITFDPQTTREELHQIYFEYFLQNDSDYWRRGIFHCAIIVYNCSSGSGFAFSTKVNDTRRLDSFLIGSKTNDNGPIYKYPIKNILKRKSLDPEYHRRISYASAMMHELGHTLGIFRSNTPGCDNPAAVFPREEWLKYLGYRSCMSYNNVFYLIDYSDGSRGKNDFNDWSTIDLTLFEKDL